MHCIVTAGPTFEPLDRVRRLTNFSTGRLGSELANFLAQRGAMVRLLIGQQATWRGDRHAQTVETFTTTADLGERLRQSAADSVDAVFHAAAVSDFGFGSVWLRSNQGELTEVKSGKFTTRQGTLLAELVPTPKIIRQLRDWFPRAVLVGWKYEVDGHQASLLSAARQQLAECRTDACVANGAAYGAGFGVVRASSLACEHCADMLALFTELGKLLPDPAREKNGR